MFNAIMHQSIKLNKLTASKNENKLLTQNFDELYNKLSLLTTIKVEEKIGKINGEYFIFYNNWRRQLWRWVYSENRDNTFNYLEDDFNMFFQFLDQVLDVLKNNTNKYIFKPLIIKINLFIKKIIKGLYKLKKTYYDSDVLKNKIDSIIITLIDFKEESTKFLDIKYISFNTIPKSNSN